MLFIGYANEEAYRETLARGSAVLYSTSREQIWHKGATSGDVLDLVEVAVNCEQNSLIYKVRKAGTGCATPRTRPARPSDLLLPGGRGRRRRSASPDGSRPDFDSPPRWQLTHGGAGLAEVLADLTTCRRILPESSATTKDSLRVGRQRRPVESVVVHRSTPRNPGVEGRSAAGDR